MSQALPAFAEGLSSSTCGAFANVARQPPQTSADHRQQDVSAEGDRNLVDVKISLIRPYLHGFLNQSGGRIDTAIQAAPNQNHLPACVSTGRD
jgi:hypothetical protein